MGSEDADPNDDYIHRENEVPFHVEIHVKNELPFQDSSISVRGFTDKESKKALPIKCKWFRAVDDRNYEIRDNPINDTYHVNAFDVGNYLKVAVKAKGFKEPAIIKIGPIVMTAKLLPELEHSLLANDGLYNIKILQVGNQPIHDESGFMNFVKFSKNFIYLKFGYQFEKSFSDFKIQLDGPFDFKVVCDNSDYRALSIFFRKDQVMPFEENILQSNPKKQREYEQNKAEWINSRSQKKPAGEIIFDAEDSIEVEQRLIKKDRNGGEIKQIFTDPFEAKLRDIEYDGDDLEIKFSFTGRLHRDAFIMALRIITTVRSVILAPLIDHTDNVFRRQWDMSLSVKEGDYNQLVG